MCIPTSRVLVKNVELDRRSRHRFDIPMEATLILRRRRMLHVTGPARVVNISSRGVAITSELNLYLGEAVTLILDWPARLDNGCPLRMKMSGKIVRMGENGVSAIEIIGYEMRVARREDRHLRPA